MIVSNIYKNLCRSRLLSYNGSLASISNNILNGTLIGYEDLKNLRKNDNIFRSTCKNYSSDTQTKPSIGLPPLCDFPTVMWPKLFSSFRNFFIINMNIKANLDPEFDEQEFMGATKQALYLVSRALANQDYERLEGLVIPEVIETLKKKVSTLSDEERDCIAVMDEDVYLTFPDNVEIFNEGESDRERKFVEIMVVHHYMRGFGRMKEKGESIPMNMLAVHQDRIFIANHRFIREFTEGVESPWILNVVNHFSPTHLLRPI